MAASLPHDRSQSSASAAPQAPSAQRPTVCSTINRRRTQLALAGLLSAVGNAAGLVPFLVIYFIAVEVLGKPLAAVNAGWLWTLAGIALGAVVMKAATTALALHVSHIAAYSILYDLRIAVADHLGRLPLGYFSARTTGQIKKVIHEDVEQMEEGLAHMIPIRIKLSYIVQEALFGHHGGASQTVMNAQELPDGYDSTGCHGHA